MKTTTHYTMLALLIGILSACSSDGTENTPTGTLNPEESTSNLNSGNTATGAGGHATKESESYTLITDNGVGTSNNQDTENPANY